MHQKNHAKQKYNKLSIWTAHLHNYRYWKLDNFAHPPTKGNNTGSTISIFFINFKFI